MAKIKKKKRKKQESFYHILSRKIEQETTARRRLEKIKLHESIRSLRKKKGLSGVEVCRRAGDLDPRTLTAVEKGRIVNPSIKTMQSISRALEVDVSDLFRRAELEIDRHFYLGTQKGAYQIDFQWWGIKAVSFTPFMRDFFCGKLIFASHKRLDQTLLKHPAPIHVSALVGKFEVEVEDKKFFLKEGENLFFNGILKHSFHNVLGRESVLLLVTAPSFL